MYFAHIRDDGAMQSVQEHLEGTAKRSGAFAAAFLEERRGVLLGYAHDIGKNSQAFQKRLQGGPKVDHATAGAIECGKLGEAAASLCVIGHHSGLPDLGNSRDSADDPTYIGRIKRGLQGGIPTYVWNGTLEAGLPMPKLKNDYAYSFWIRMLYSCLVDADFLDTEAFMTQEERTGYDALPDLLERLYAYIAPWFPAKTELNMHRCNILEECLAAASRPRGLYSLMVPTGGGKTVASLAFALKHAVENSMDRVIYVIPYTSIIEQNARVFCEILGESNVIEHHSGVQYDSDEELSGSRFRQRLACENWDAPVIVTTAVQFFESLYANRSSQCRKLHNIANSVIIFDEAQMIPGCHLKPCMGAIANLVSHFRATAVLCTATQPVLEDLLQSFCPELSVTEICQQVGVTYEIFRRVTYRDGGKLSNEALAEQLMAESQVLCIVNTRKMAQDVAALLPEEGRFHLSTRMYPVHRSRVLDMIRNRLRDGRPCRVVSTSLIEAGVDVDFPAVYRQMAGLDSLIQAAGRCNREGKRRPEESIVTYFEGEQPEPALQKINVCAAREVLRDSVTAGDPETIRSYFSAWRSLVGDNLDKSDAVRHLSGGIGGCRLPFRAVAESFHLIDDNAKTVYIPVEEEAKQIVCRMLEGTASRRDYRQAGRYSVNVYERHYEQLLSSGDVEPLDDGSGVLVNLSMYDAQMGLSPQVEFGKAFFG